MSMFKLMWFNKRLGNLINIHLIQDKDAVSSESY